LPVMRCRTPTSAIFGVLKQGFTTVAERWMFPWNNPFHPTHMSR